MYRKIETPQQKDLKFELRKQIIAEPKMLSVKQLKGEAYIYGNLTLEKSIEHILEVELNDEKNTPEYILVAVKIQSLMRRELESRSGQKKESLKSKTKEEIREEIIEKPGILQEMVLGGSSYVITNDVLVRSVNNINEVDLALPDISEHKKGVARKVLMLLEDELKRREVETRGQMFKQAAE
jgi:hypothetical protein